MEQPGQGGIAWEWSGLDRCWNRDRRAGTRVHLMVETWHVVVTADRERSLGTWDHSSSEG